MCVNYTTSLGAKVRAERQGKIRLAHARTCGVTKACTSKWQTMPLDHAQLTSTYHIGLQYVQGKCCLDQINVCKIHNLLRAKMGAEKQGDTNLNHAGTCGVTKACKSKCCKRCLWPMLSSQASTLLGWSVCMANAVWTQISVFAKMQQSATTPHTTPHYHTTTHHITPHTQLNHYTTHPNSHKNTSMHVPKIW